MAKTGGITIVDVGSYNVKAALGEKVSDGFKILSYSTVKTNGFSAGAIVDAVNLKASVGEALGELQTQLVKKVSGGQLIVTISSNVFTLENVRIDKSLSSEKPETVRPSHINDIRIEASKDKNTVDVIPIRYTLDDGRNVVNPLSMPTQKLSAELLRIKVAESSKEALLNLFEGFSFDSVLVMHPGILTAEGVLNESEKTRGIVCLEIGYTTTKVIAYNNGVPVSYYFLPFGVEKIVKDIATVFKVSYPEAERLLFYHSNLDYENVKEDEMVETTDFDKTKKQLKKRSISLAAYARGRELLSISRRSVAPILGDPSFNPVGLVITGGGASIPGITSVGASVFNMTARSGTYASSNNVMITGAEEVMAVPAYSPLFGAFVYTFRYGANPSVIKSTSASVAPSTQKTVLNGPDDVGEGFLKKVWEFLKKLV